MKFRLFTIGTLVAASMQIAASQAAAGLPQASVSTAGGGGGAPVSDGITPENGGVVGNFEYGGEAGVGTKTTVVDFQLPAGTTVPSDPSCDFGFGELCLDMETDCS